MQQPEKAADFTPASACFVTWIRHRRTRELCSRLGIELAEFVTERRGVVRYLHLIPQTIGYLFRRRPKVLLLQAPSMVLALLGVLLRPWIRYTLVLDAHNEAVEPFLNPSLPVRALSHWLLAKADYSIVSNTELASEVSGHRGRPIVLRDPLPPVPALARKVLQGIYRVAVISTYAGDEPVESILRATSEAPSGTHFYFTGNPEKLPESIRSKLPPVVTLTGFLSDNEYWNLLASCDVVMDLTTMNSCLVCGAYEAIAVGKPLILSNNRASMEVFQGFAEFTDDTPGGIAAAIRRSQQNQEQRLGTFSDRTRQFEREWSEESLVLRNVIEQRA